jgi:hypothetical protein
MKASLHRCLAASLHPFQRFNHFTACFALIFGSLIFSSSASAQFSTPDKNSARSVSGQFIVHGTSQFSPLARSPRVAADTNLVRLEPALLVVSAERIKESLWRTLEIKASTSWRGQIHLVLHPAQSPDENVTIISQPFAHVWNYRVELPDVLSQSRLVRALTAVLLLEYANRNAQSHSAEIPTWLIDGLSQQLLAADSPEFILSMPSKTETILSLPSKSIDEQLPVTRLNTNTRGMDSLTSVRRVLNNYPALTFEQLSWPTGAQLNGEDGGVYRASAQLFVSDLLKLKNGPTQLRTMLESLPQFYNWQLAFQSAFRGFFPRPLDLEKWWALQVVNFVSFDPGPGWTLAVSREKLDEILRVAVETRVKPNSLPEHSEISLQAVIRNLNSARQTPILQTKLRDLQLAQLRMAPQWAGLTDGYRRALAGYLGERQNGSARPVWIKHMFGWLQKTSASKTLMTLDALDARRRALETPPQIVPVQPGVDAKKLN